MGRAASQDEAWHNAVLQAEDRPFDRAGWIFEIKWDGYRVIAEMDKGYARLYSRNGLSFTERYHGVATALEKIRHQAVLDGEVVVLDDKGHPSFEALQNYRSHRTAGHLVYEVFDIIYLDGHDLRGLPLLRRREIPSADPSRGPGPGVL